MRPPTTKKRYAADFGAPQERKRFIAGPRAMISKLSAMADPTLRVSVEEAMRRNGYECRTRHVSNKGANSGPRSVKRCGYTIKTDGGFWCSEDGSRTTVMTPDEVRVMMGLPASFRLTGEKMSDRFILGNGVCYPLARAIRGGYQTPIGGDRYGDW